MSVAHVFTEVFRGLSQAISFFCSNSLTPAPNTPTRHPWRWCVFIFLDALVWVFAASRPGRNTGLVLVNRLGDAILSRDFVECLSQKVEQDGPGELIVIGDTSWEVLKDTIYSNYKIVFIDEARFRMEFIYRYRTALKIAGLRIKDCYCLMHHRLEMRDESLMSFTGADRRIVTSMPFLSDRWYPWVWRATSQNFEIVQTPKLEETTGSEVQGIPLNCAHVYHRQQSVVAALGLEVPTPEIIETSKLGPAQPENLIVLAVGAQSVVLSQSFSGAE